MKNVKKKKIIINADPAETRVAIIEDGVLAELLVDRPSDRTLVGSVFKGKVTGMLKGIEAAFVELGTGKQGFLHASEVMQDEGLPPGMEDEFSTRDSEAPKGGDSRKGGRRRHAPPQQSSARISKLLNKNQDILVQVTKDAISSKGPRITGYIALPGRFVVLMPGVKNVGVSRRIESQAERHRLRDIARKILPAGSGLILRTVSNGATEEQIVQEVRELQNRWERISLEAERRTAPALLYGEPPLAQKVVRDYLSPQVTEVMIDDASLFQEIQADVAALAPDLKGRIHYYAHPEPVFDAYHIEEEIDRIMRKKVPLKCGGYLLFDITDACVVVDVNSGRYAGKDNVEETIFRANLEAAEEITRQLRLRDVGGIIILDFIDMEKQKNKNAVMEKLRAGVRDDKAKTNIYEISPLGLVEMTRKRVRESHYEAMTQSCPYCEGRGQVLSAGTLAVMVQRMLTRLCYGQKVPQVIVKVHPAVSQVLLSGATDRLDTVRRETGARIEITSDASMHWGDIQALTPSGQVLDKMSGKGKTEEEMRSNL